LSINTLAGPAMDTFQRRTWWRFRHHSRITHLGTLRAPVAPNLAAGGCEVISVPASAAAVKPEARKTAAIFPVRDAWCVSQSIER
jgi:hypothetical protein